MVVRTSGHKSSDVACSMAQALNARAKLSLRRKRLDEARHRRQADRAIGSRAQGASLTGGGAEETPRPDCRSPGREERKAVKDSPGDSACLQHIASSPALEGGARAEVVELAGSKGALASAEQGSTNPINNIAKTEVKAS